MFKIIINFIIYVERSMSIFIVYIGIIRPEYHFDYTNIKVPIAIIKINFNENLKMAYLTIFVIFYVDVINCQIFNLLHIYRIFAKNLIFWNDLKKINHIVSKHISYYVK